MGLCVWKVLSTPTPLDIFLTIKDEPKPLFLMESTTPSNGCNLSLVPSTTLTSTTTVSPGEKLGISSLSCEDSTVCIYLFLFTSI